MGPDLIARPMLFTSDLWSCICLHLDECSHLAMLAQVDRRLHSLVSIHSNLGGKQIWLQMGLRITGYSKETLPFTTEHQQFKRCMQLLLCPWLSEPSPLPFKLPAEEVRGDAVCRLRIWPLDSSTLHYEMRRVVYNVESSEMLEADQAEVQYVMPSRPNTGCSSGSLYVGDVPLARHAHDKALSLMLGVVKREGLLMHDCKVLGVSLIMLSGPW